MLKLLCASVPLCETLLSISANSFSAAAAAKASSLMWQSSSISSVLPRCWRMASKSDSRAAGSSNGWPARSMAETPCSGSRMAAGPLAAASLRPISSPSLAFSSGVVRISVTLALWTWNLRSANFSGTVSRGPKLTMSSAPTRDDLRNAHLGGGGQAVWAGGEDAADQLVGQLGRGDVEHAGDQAVADQRFHRLAAVAGGVKDEHFVAGVFEDLAGVLDAGRGDAEHRGGDEGAVGLRIAELRIADSDGSSELHHPRHRGGGFAQNRAADAVDAGDIDDRVEHQDVFVADLGPHLAGGERADHQLGHAERQRPHRGRADGRAGRAAEAEDAFDLSGAHRPRGCARRFGSRGIDGLRRDRPAGRRSLCRPVRPRRPAQSAGRGGTRPRAFGVERGKQVDRHSGAQWLADESCSKPE